MRWGRSAPGYRLLAIGCVTMVGPCLVLAFMGARGLWRERQSVEQRLQARLDHSVAVAAESLAEQLQRLQSHAEGALRADFRGDLPPDGSWALVVRDGDAIRVSPENVLPYELGSNDAPRDPAPATRAEIAHGRAKSLERAGKVAEAVAAWRTLEAQGGTIGGRPAELVAGFELARRDRSDAQRFFDRLAAGRWRVDKVRYSYYESHVREHVTASHEAEARVRLAAAVEAVLAGSRVVASEQGVYVGFLARTPFAALVVADRFFDARVPPAADAQVSVSRIAADGHVLYRGPHTGPSGLRAAQRLGISGISWEIEVRPKDAATFGAAAVRQVDIYLGMLGLFLVLFAVGAVVIGRNVRREVEVARLKSDFVATVSHEFRSPLTGVRQLAEMLVRDRVPDENARHHYYELILHESERLARLVESVLDFARMEDGRKQYRREPLDATVWLRGVAKEFEREAMRAGYVLETSIPDRLPPLSGDREALSTAVHNLLDNAIKYSPATRIVWLEASASGAGVRISVRDRGAGIPLRDRPRIFEKFYRVDGELSKRVKGVGLGLSLVRHIVRAHGGTVSVDSREGEGSTFSIELARAA